jgi:peptide/nickel transport system ATP-binding protein
MALEVRGLSVAYRRDGRDRRAVDDLTFAIPAGASYGLVGESGCGKSTVAVTLVGYLPANGRIEAGDVHLAGQDLRAAKGEALRRLRSDTVAMVYQSPGRALNPTMRIGAQIAEAFAIRGASRAESRERALDMLRKVQIADREVVMRRYPHELSGGMQQRVVIAMALAKNPELLILVEPTTGLDATVEAEVLDLIAALREEFRTAVLFISHNLDVVARMCERVGVLYAGRLVEEGSTDVVFANPRHPYTASLLGCLPQLGARKDQGPLTSIPGALPELGSEPAGCVFADRGPIAEPRCRQEAPPLVGEGDHGHRCFYPERVRTAQPDVLAPVPGDAAEPALVLSGRSISKTFGHGSDAAKVLTDVSLDLRAGETLGVVGESGSGKSTLARILLGLVEPDDGATIELSGEELTGRVQGRSTGQVRDLQIVFQNPDSALNHRHTVRRILFRALRRLSALPRSRHEERARELLEHVRLSDTQLDTLPGSLSGGMKQRVAIARAFAGDPRVVVCDEPTSALDVSVQAAILNLLVNLQREDDVSYVFISHDLAVVRYLADRIMVMYLGRVMEVGDAETVFAAPSHPYTEALLSASRDERSGLGGGRLRLEGEPPSVRDQPTGCVFHPRCPRKLGAICEAEAPPVQKLPSGHAIRCHIPADDLVRLQTTDELGDPGIAVRET